MLKHSPLQKNFQPFFLINRNHGCFLSRVSVIIVNYNGGGYIGKCLDSLLRQSFKDFTISVVDNGSSDGSVEYIRQKYPKVCLICLGKNLGFSAANNTAIRLSAGEYIALLNADAIPDPSWMKKLVESMDSFPAAGFAASKMLYSDRPKVIDRAGDGYTRAGAGLLRGRGEDASNYCRQGWIFGACAGAAIYRKSMLEDIGLFDEDFFLLYEDLDLSFRAQLHGYRCLYVPEAMVYHMASATIGYDSPVSVYYGHRNLEWTYLQNMPKSLIPKTIHRHLCYDLAAFFYFLARGKRKIFFRAKIDAIKGLRSAMKKRKEVQKKKRVDDRYIWSMLDIENYFNRLTRRLKKDPG